MRTAVSLFIVIAVAGCGPSLRRTYQSDRAFASCFDRDYDADIELANKRSCWETWLEKRVVHQPSDKVAYAQLRLREIDAGVTVPGPPGPQGKFDQRPAPEIPALKAAPPASSPESTPVGTDDPAPGKACREGCRQSLLACRNACHDTQNPQSESEVLCSSACDSGFTACMKSCAVSVYGEETNKAMEAYGKDSETPSRETPTQN